MFRLRGADEEVHLLMGAEPMRDEANRVVGAVAIASDITHLHRLEREKDEFLSIASHELRTPLTTILANALIAERRLTRLITRAAQTESSLLPELEDLRKLLARSTSAAERQKRLADDLLDVSRIQRGDLDLRPAPCDLAALVSDIVAGMRTAFPSRTITLETSSRPLKVLADADRIGQVVTNYLSNALKYSTEDESVAVRLRADDAAARLEVRDHGPGLPPEEHERIWERFYRAEGIAHRYGSGVGLGLGLYICKTIVERHGGRVGLDSAPGAGSTFWFELPLMADVPV